MRVLEANFQENYEPAAEAHFVRMSDKSDVTLLHDLNELIRGLDEDGVWDKIAILCVAHNNKLDTQLNLKGIGSDPDVTIIGSTFIENVGVTCESTGLNYINFGIPENGISNYALYDGHFMVYPQATAANKEVMQVLDSAVDDSRIWVASSTKFHAIQQDSGTGTALGGVTTGGFHGSTVRASNDRRHINAAGAIGSSTNYTAVLGVKTINIGLVWPAASVGNDLTYSAWGLGAGLTNQELSDYKTRIDIFAVARGFDV